MYVLLFCMCQYVGLEIGRLRKFLVAAVKGAHVRPVAGVDADVCAQVKVEGEPLATALECALKTTTSPVNVRNIFGMPDNSVLHQDFKSITEGQKQGGNC